MFGEDFFESNGWKNIRVPLVMLIFILGGVAIYYSENNGIEHSAQHKEDLVYAKNVFTLIRIPSNEVAIFKILNYNSNGDPEVLTIKHYKNIGLCVTTNDSVIDCKILERFKQIQKAERLKINE